MGVCSSKKASEESEQTDTQRLSHARQASSAAGTAAVLSSGSPAAGTAVTASSNSTAGAHSHGTAKSQSIKVKIDKDEKTIQADGNAAASGVGGSAAGKSSEEKESKQRATTSGQHDTHLYGPGKTDKGPTSGVGSRPVSGLAMDSDRHSHSPAVERSQKSGYPSLASRPYSMEIDEIDLEDEKRPNSAPSKYEEMDTLLTIPFFEELGSKNLKELRSIFQRRVAQPGEIVMHEGTKESCFHIIISGKVEVLAKSDVGTELVTLREIGKGEFFGDLVLVQDSIQPVTIRALEADTTILYIRTEDFSEALSRFPELSVSVDVVGRNPPLKVQLKNIPFFAEVSESKLHILGTLCEVRKFRERTIICEQGSAADGFYYIITGRVEVSVTGTDKEMGSKIHLDTLTAGDWFGEIALLEQTRRTATVTATQESVVLYLSKQRFDRFLRVAPEVLDSGVFDQLVRKRTANTLKSIPLFAGLKRKQIGPSVKFDEARLAILGQLFRFVNVDGGQIIFREGDPGEAFYIIMKGTVVVSAKNPDGADSFLAELRTNDWFGETSLLNNTRCNATVVSKTNCVLLKLMGENFQHFLRVAPEVESSFRSRMSARTAERLRKIPFFTAVRENKPWSKLDLLGGLFYFEEMPGEQVVFKEGEVGDKFYLIVSGNVEVCVKRADSFYLLDTLGPDDWFGEIALMRNTPRTATVTCKGDCVFLTLTSDKFQKFLAVAPELTEHFQSLLSHRTANILKTMDLFKYLNENRPWSKVEMMGALFNYVMKKEGEVVYAEGDVADKFFLLMSGSVRMTSTQIQYADTPRSGPHPAATAAAAAAGVPASSPVSSSSSPSSNATLLSPSSNSSPAGSLPTTPRPRLVHAQAHFGEADILHHRPRRETATASVNSILLYINVDAFFQLMKFAPELQRYFDQEEAKRRKKEIAEEEAEKQKEKELAEKNFDAAFQIKLTSPPPPTSASAVPSTPQSKLEQKQPNNTPSDNQTQPASLLSSPSIPVNASAGDSDDDEDVTFRMHMRASPAGSVSSTHPEHVRKQTDDLTNIVATTSDAIANGNAASDRAGDVSSTATVPSAIAVSAAASSSSVGIAVAAGALSVAVGGTLKAGQRIKFIASPTGASADVNGSGSGAEADKRKVSSEANTPQVVIAPAAAAPSDK